MSASLANQVVLITGASSGFGASSARLFAQEGAIVILAARRVDRLTALAEEIRTQGGQATILPLDITDQPQVEQAITALIAQFGHIDILFNNAGFGRLDWLENLDPQRDIATQLDVNLVGLIQVTRAVLPHMYRRHSGHIINMSSVAGHIAAPLYTIYSAAKYGVRGFTDALRREAYPLGVKVSGIYPGPAATEFSQHTGHNSVKQSVKAPKFLSMSSEKVAQRVVRLARAPRRTVILPAYFHLVFLVERLFPFLTDLFLNLTFVKRFHTPGENHVTQTDPQNHP